MTEKIRVIVVDDSAFYRQAISRVLNTEPRIEVVSTASNGKVALTEISKNLPDLITLDMEMPELSGLETLQKLQHKHCNTKTIIFSHHTEEGAELTMQALALGAIDFVTKPTSCGTLNGGLQQIKKDLLPKIIEFSTRFHLEQPRHSTYKPNGIFPHNSAAAQRDVIALGVSTGGPASLMQLFPQIPSTLKQSLLIVQHMPAIFTKKLAEQLSKVSQIPVSEACNDDIILPGHAYIAPGGLQMEVVQKHGHKRIRTFEGSPEQYCRPSVDILFESVAKIYGQRAVGVIMTGMGRDGLRGAEALKAKGVPIIVQDQATSVVWGMPRFIVEAHLADAITPLNNMLETIKNFIC